MPKKYDTDLFPFSLLEIGEQINNEIAIEANPSLLLIKNGHIEKVVVNGLLFDLEKDKEKIMRLVEGF
ncbi:MAG: hypothetical protein R2825_25035 [Saprospiraceae bacterium]